MNKKNVAVNYIYNLIYQILLILVPLITTPYLSRTLGAEGIGEYSYAEALATYFVLAATMGITYYGQREIAYLQDDKDKEKRTQLFWETKSLTLVISLVVLVVYIFLAFLQDNIPLYLVLSINIINVFFDITWLYQGMEDFSIITTRNGFFKLLNIVYIFVFVKNRDDVVIYALGVSGMAILANMSLWKKLPQYIGKPKLSMFRPFKNIKVIISLFIPTIAIQVYTVLDKTMIGVITGSQAQNGYYDQAIRLSKVVLTLVTALGTVMIPQIGYHYKKKETELVRSFLYRGYNFVWFLGIPLCFGLIGTASNIVPWFYGEGFEEVIYLLSTLSFLILAIGINNVTGIQYLIPTERQNTFTFTVILGACANFIMNLVLIPKFQARGAAIASVFAETLIAIVQLIIIRKEISIPKIIIISWKYLASGLIMFGALKFEGRYLSPSWYNSVIMFVTGAMLYFVMLLILKDKFLIQYLAKIINKIKK